MENEEENVRIVAKVLVWKKVSLKSVEKRLSNGFWIEVP